MATESNMGFCHEGSFGSPISQHTVSFQSGAINSSTNMIQMMNYYGVNENTGIAYPNSNVMSSSSMIPQAGGSLLVESVPGLKHDTGLAVEWSAEEQYKLEEGLKKHEDEPSIMKYIKIAAMLRDKTVRDVALRCRWMTDKVVESSSMVNICTATPSNLAPYSLFMNHLDHNEQHIPIDAFNGTTRLLLEKNNQVLNQISANMSVLKLQENVNLFLHIRNNLDIILNDMREMPGIMSRMPPLPVTVNEGLASSLLPTSTSQL